MAFTTNELASIANAALDYHFRGQPLPQSIQEKPLLAKLESATKSFPGGKGDITKAVKGKYEYEGSGASRDGDLSGYTHNDTVSYGTIAGIERARYPWRELHTGLTFTYTEAKIDGITIVDTLNSTGEKKHSKRELTAITNIMEDKAFSMSEILSRQMNDMLWGDGTNDPLAFLGVQYFITATPEVGTTGGIDRATNEWWRNRYVSFDGTGTSDLVETFNTEMRQLRRFGGRPNLFLCGSDFLDALTKAVREKGLYTDSNWSRPSSTNLTIAALTFGGVEFHYDPTLDDLGLAKSCFMIDTKHMYIMAMDQEWGRRHHPARPHDEYASYTSITYSGQLIADQLNCHGRIDIA
jgi:hypothetical protein